jgi:hypothetical protein
MSFSITRITFREQLAAIGCERFEISLVRGKRISGACGRAFGEGSNQA